MTYQSQDHTQGPSLPMPPSSGRPALRLSSNPKKAMQEMMDTIDELRAVYQQETQALLASDADGFMAMQDAKLNAARNYQDGIAQMIARKEEMKSVDPVLKSQLRTMQADFSKLADKNMRALHRMQKAMERFGSTLREAARDAVKKERSTGYTANGKMLMDETKSISSGISETA
jgi:ElaB/YqjD/DUF883 family membrane-anchored ribosome-binding protein